MTSEKWLGNPYFPISQHYKQLFGEKVYKIPVTTVDDCPNRRGLKGMETCIFCDVWGSAARAESMDMDLKEQIIKYKDHIGKRFKAKKFLVYFQAYTNTFEKASILEKQFEVAAEFEDVVGFVVGTRPDCLSPKVMEIWQKYHEKRFVSVELGVQTFNDKDLEWMKRGHTAEQSLKAIERIHKNTDVDLGIHLMFGQPNDTKASIIESAKISNDLPISNIKLHNLHVLKNTPLEKIYNEGNFIPIERAEYAECVELFLSHLRPDIAVHRLSALASRWDELVAPAWAKQKMESHQFIINHMKELDSFQGKFH